MLRKDTQHAMRAMAAMARLDGQATLSTIADASNAPVPALSKILQRLSKHGLIAGRPGPGGGYQLSKPAEDIPLARLIDIFEGSEFGNTCLMGHGGCETECPMHTTWDTFITDLRKYLAEHSVADLKSDGLFVPVVPMAAP